MNFFLTEEQIVNDKLIQIVGDQVHHFKNVGRGKPGDLVKAFDGNGTIYSGVVTNLKKKQLEIEVTNREVVARKRLMNLILGVPKREYLDSILKSSVQLGLSKVYLVHTKFSPQKYKSTPRQEKLLISAVTQSENPYLPEIVLLNSLEDIFSIEGEKLAFSTEIEDEDVSFEKKRFDSFIIGPEGGFHQEELSLLKNDSKVKLVKCPTAIMKAEVAVSYAAGMIDAYCASLQNQ